jgi:putative flavoprotein involved in K+ transport
MSALPGLPFPAAPRSYPGKDAVAGYLEHYARSKGLPVVNGVHVDELRPADGGRGYAVRAGERWFAADQVVVATGAYQAPAVPSFAAELDPAITQLHARDYRNPGQLADGPVLIVGGGNTGAEIALDVAGTHRTTLSGRNPGEMPFESDGRLDPLLDSVMFWAAKHLLTRRNPIGRRQIREILDHGTPVERAKLSHQRAAGVERLFARTVGVRDGQPLLDDGTVIPAMTVIWATGYRPDFDWIRLPILDADGWPRQQRGVIAAAPGLYTLGLPFMDSLASALIGGVGRDAAYLAPRIAAHARSTRTSQVPATRLRAAHLRPASRAAEHGSDH